MKYFLLILCCNTLFIFGQDRQLIDSLQRVIARTTSIDQKITALNDLSWEYAETDAIAAIRYARSGITLSKKYNKSALLSNSYNMLGTAFDFQGTADSAQFYYQKSLVIRKKNKDWKGVGNIYNNQGACFFIQGNAEKALENYLSALKIRINEKDTLGIAQSYNNLGLVYRTMEDYTNAIRVYQKSLEFKRKLADFKGLCLTHLNLSTAYQNLGQFSDAEKNSLKALHYAEKLNDEVNIGSARINLAAVYLRKGELEKALYNNEKAASIFRTIHSEGDEASMYSIFGEIYLSQGKYQMAESAFFKSNEISALISKVEIIKENNRLLSELYERTNQAKKSLAYYKSYQNLKDSLFSVKNKENVKRLELQFDTELRDTKIKELNAASKVSELELQFSKRNSLLLIVIVLALVGIISIGGYFFLKVRKQKVLLDEQNNVIQSALLEREMLLREINHRVKNNMQIIIGLLELQNANASEIDPSKFIEDAKQRIEAMSLIHEILYTKENLSLENYSQLYFESLLAQIAKGFSLQSTVSQTVIVENGLLFEQMIPLGLIINELTTNSFKHCLNQNASEAISLSIQQINEASWQLIYSDFGGVNYLNSTSNQSFGTTLVHLLTRQLQGVLQHDDDGRIVMQFPVKKG
ncbi:MAG: tetratricopeptide repeat protein [Bacteroidota bacterium]